MYSRQMHAYLMVVTKRVPITVWVQWVWVIVHAFMNNQSKKCWDRQGNNNNKQQKGKATKLAWNRHFSKKNWLPRVGFKPMTISSLGDRRSYHLSYRAYTANPIAIFVTKELLKMFGFGIIHEDNIHDWSSLNLNGADYIYIHVHLHVCTVGL